MAELIKHSPITVNGTKDLVLGCPPWRPSVFDAAALTGRPASKWRSVPKIFNCIIPLGNSWILGFLASWIRLVSAPGFGGLDRVSPETQRDSGRSPRQGRRRLRNRTLRRRLEEVRNEPGTRAKRAGALRHDPLLESKPVKGSAGKVYPNNSKSAKSYRDRKARSGGTTTGWMPGVLPVPVGSAVRTGERCGRRISWSKNCDSCDAPPIAGLALGYFGIQGVVWEFLGRAERRFQLPGG